MSVLWRPKHPGTFLTALMMSGIVVTVGVGDGVAARGQSNVNACQKCKVYRKTI